MIKPLNNKVVVKMDKTETKTKSGIILSAESQKESIYGTIVALGKDTDEELKVGQRVMLDKFHSKVEIEEDTFLIEDTDILGIEI